MSIEYAYNIWASQYDTNENNTRDLDQKITIEILSKYEFDYVVELGCGTGKNTTWLLTKAEQIIGLDFSEVMLRHAKDKLTDPRVEFISTDLNHYWPVDDDYADLITSSLTLEHIEDLDHIFSQARQKLRASGIFFISELHPYKQYTGSKARFETEDDGVQELEVYTHHITDYTECAERYQFELLELNEWFDEENKEGELPRLISFVFRRKG